MEWTTAHSLTYFYIGIAQQSDTKIYDQEIDFIKKILSNVFDADQASIDQVVKESLNEYNKDLFEKGVGHCQQMYVACGESYAKHQVDSERSPSLKNVFHDLIMNSVELVKSDDIVFDTEKAVVDVLIEYWDMDYDDEELEGMWEGVNIIGWSEERISQHTEKLQKEKIKSLFDAEIKNTTEESKDVNLHNLYKKICNDGEVLLEQVHNTDGTKRFIWFDDAANEASWENEVLSDTGYAFHLYEKHLYFAVVNFYTRERLEPQNIYLLENGLFKYLLGFLQETECLETGGELLDVYPWLENFSFDKDYDYTQDYSNWEEKDKELFQSQNVRRMKKVNTEESVKVSEDNQSSSGKNPEKENEDILEKNFEKYYNHKELYNYLVYPQGDYPKMSYDFFDVAIVMMCFLADTNGDGINQDEQHEIMTLAKLLHSSYLSESISSQDGNLKMNEAVDWYYAISDKFPETNDYANEAFWSKMRWFKDQDWFDNALAQTLLDAFVKLAKNSNAGATNYEINRIYVVAFWWKQSNVVVKNLHYLDAACDKNQLSENDIAWTKDENIKHLIEHADSEIASLQSSLDQSESTNEESENSDSVLMTDSLRHSKLTFDDYINTYKEEHPNEDQDENLLRATVDFLYEAVQGEDGLLEIFSRTGGYSTYANNKLKNGKFAQVRWSKSDRKEGKPRRYFVDLYLLKSRMNYKIESLPNQSLQSPHADEFYVIRLYSQDDLWNNEDLLSGLIKDSFKSRQKNKLITKRKNFTKKELKKEYLKDAGVL